MPAAARGGERVCAAAALVARAQRRRGARRLRGGRRRGARGGRGGRRWRGAAALRARLRGVDRGAQRLVRGDGAIHEAARALVRHRRRADHPSETSVRRAARSRERPARPSRGRGEPLRAHAESKRHLTERAGRRLDRPQRRSLDPTRYAVDLGRDEPHASATRILLHRPARANGGLRQTGHGGAAHLARSPDRSARGHAGPAAHGALCVGCDTRRLRSGDDARDRTAPSTPTATAASRATRPSASRTRSPTPPT